MVACPACHRLVYSDRLQHLRSEAEKAGSEGDRSAEIAAWREALSLLPSGSRQHAVIAERLDSLSRSITTQTLTDGPPATGRWKWLSGLGVVGAALWKAKFLLIALLSKGKLVLLGLTKASTFFSMLLAFGVYWTTWGMWFAAGLVLSIYIHEMGHVAALRRYGIAATSPMFIPGLGAFIRLQAGRLAPREDARIGLAGPRWGTLAAAATLAAVPAGGPAVAAIRAFDRGAPEEPDNGVAAEFAILTLSLALLVRFSATAATAGTAL